MGTAAWLALVGLDGEAQALSIARIIGMASRYTPWKSNCFPQALAAGILLKLYGIPYSLFFGIENKSGTLRAAHAWVFAGKVPVTGGDSFGKFTVVGCFVSPSRSL